MSRLHLGVSERSESERSEGPHPLKRFASLAESFERLKIDSSARIEGCLSQSTRSVCSLVDVPLQYA
jgi:hypothetical protein